MGMNMAEKRAAGACVPLLLFLGVFLTIVQFADGQLTAETDDQSSPSETSEKRYNSRRESMERSRERQAASQNEEKRQSTTYWFKKFYRTIDDLADNFPNKTSFLKKAFRLFDIDKNNQISRQEFYAIMDFLLT